MWGREPPDHRDWDVDHGWTALVIACVLILILLTCAFGIALWGDHRRSTPERAPSISTTDERTRT